MNQHPDLLRRLLRAKDRIDAASDQPWSIPRLAKVSGASPAHFARAFKRAFGLPPHRYLLTSRIERAAALLRDSDLPVTDIAFATGWSSLGSGWWWRGSAAMWPGLAERVSGGAGGKWA